MHRQEKFYSISWLSGSEKSYPSLLSIHGLFKYTFHPKARKYLHIEIQNSFSCSNSRGRKEKGLGCLKTKWEGKERKQVNVLKSSLGEYVSGSILIIIIVVIFMDLLLCLI